MIYAQKGFTLIELMVILMIMAILMAVAYGSYQQFVIKNAESEVKAQMGQLETQLAQWRASALTYRGFVPKQGVDNNGRSVYQYSNAANTSVFVPIDSTQDNYRYQIFIFDGGTSSTSLVPTTGDLDVSTGRSWVMRAVPNPDGVAGEKGRIFLQRSAGLKCATLVSNASNLPANETECDPSGSNNLEVW